MKALTLWEPWASLIAYGPKRHETRRHATDYRGPLAIHAGSQIVPAKLLKAELAALCESILGPDWEVTRTFDAVLAITQLVEIHPAPEIRDMIAREDRLCGNFTAGRYAWRLANPCPFEVPIPWRGKSGLWEWQLPHDVRIAANDRSEGVRSEPESRVSARGPVDIGTALGDHES